MSDTKLYDARVSGRAEPTVDIDIGDVVLVDETGETEAPRRQTWRERRAERPPRPPRGTREWIQAATTFLVVGSLVLFTFVQLHPSKIFTSAVPTGGDMGAHVWSPAYLRDHLLTNWQLSGWSMDWYGGLPVYRYYMIPPALLIVALDVVLPYGMAFKIVAVLGLLTLPICVWAFGKLARFPYPVPALFALASTIFMFDETFTILGGNVASTMAGEFSFSIVLSLAMLALGVFARGMETGRHRALAATLIALAALCHGIVVFFVALGAVLMFLVWADRHRLVYFLTTSVVALMLAAFWIVPFVLTSNYMTDMKYEGAPTPGGEWDSYWRMFFPHLTTVDILWTLGAVVGFVGSLIRRNRMGSFLGIYALVLTALIFLSKDGIPGFGLLWNVRLLPFLYLLRYLLAMVGIVELVWFVLRVVRNERVVEPIDASYPDLPLVALPYGTRPREVARRRLYFSMATLVAVSLGGVGWLSWHLGKFPGQVEVYRDDRWQFRWPGENGFLAASSVNNGFVDAWADWNFRGYVGRPHYGEFRSLVETMKGLGADPAHGCGRALWEHSGGEYGTTMALMTLPFWTDSCIGSMEGLYFEASASTPYHFLSAAALSDKASNPVRGLSYTNQDAALGTRYLQTLGVRYYMAYTPGAIDRAALQPDLLEVAVSGPWHIYEVVGSDLVVPLTTEPVVVDERPGDQRERWLEVGASWFQHPELWTTMPVADGPDSWAKVAVATDQPQPHPTVDLVKPVQPIEPVPLPRVTVSNTKMSDQSLSFDVDQVGVPVLVKVSYYPNWKVDGGDGPYRVAPNLMVVIPTDTSVRLVYAPSGLDLGANAVSVLGLFALALLWWRGPVRYPPGDWWEPYPEEPDPFGDSDTVARRARPSGEPDVEPELPPWIPRSGPSDDWAPPSPAMAVDADWLADPLPADPTGSSPDEHGAIADVVVDQTVETERPSSEFDWPAQPVRMPIELGSTATPPATDDEHDHDLHDVGEHDHDEQNVGEHDDREHDRGGPGSNGERP